MLTAYMTTMGRLDQIILPKIQQWVMGSLLNDDGFLTPIYKDSVYRISRQITPDECPSFVLPFATAYKQAPIVVVDTRTFERPDGRIVKQLDYNATIARGILEYQWIDDKGNFLPVADLLSYIFAQWISTMINSRYGTSIFQNEQIRVWLMAYYRTLFFTDEELVEYKGDQLQEYLSRTVIRGGHVAGQVVADVMNSEDFKDWSYNSDHDLNSLLKHMTAYLDTQVLKLDTGALISLCVKSTGGAVSWFGYGAQQMAGAALEHPPLLAWMAAQCTNQGSYLKTFVGRAYESAKRARLNVDSLARWYTEMVHA